MAAAIACHRPDLIDAAATVAGAFYNPVLSDCQPNPAPMLVIHGTGDDIISHQGGTRHGAPYRSVYDVSNATVDLRPGAGHSWYPDASEKIMGFFNSAG